MNTWLAVPYFLLYGLVGALLITGAGMAIGGLRGRVASKLLCREADQLIRAAARGQARPPTRA